MTTDEQRPDLERVGEAIAKLYATYTPEGVGVWMRGTNKTLDGRSPLGLIIEGRADEFCVAVDRLSEGMNT